MSRGRCRFAVTLIALISLTSAAFADPCGMVPPIYTGPGVPIARTGDQNTYVFYKNGVENFVIHPAFTGKVDEFGMLIPFPTVPELRKVPDNIFSHVRAAIDPPEVIVRIYRAAQVPQSAVTRSAAPGAKNEEKLKMAPDAIRVVKEEAVGMYEVAVLQAGSSKALKRWMTEHGYQYPKGMDTACDDYVKIGWCFVAVKTKVGRKKGADPKPGQRRVNTRMPKNFGFDGNVQAMGFRFKTDKLIVPMRLSTFNEGNLHNIVYVLADSALKIRSVPEEYVVRQVSGSELIDNVTNPLPLRIIGGTAKQLNRWQRRSLSRRRNPVPHNGSARDLFAADVSAAISGKLSHPHEEKEKMLLRIGERLMLRGPNIDKLNADALSIKRERLTKDSLKDIKGMTLSVIDGNYPREVLANQNLTFANFKMAARRNSPRFYDAKIKKPTGPVQGTLHEGKLSDLDSPKKADDGKVSAVNEYRWPLSALLATGLIGLLLAGRYFGKSPADD